MTNNKLGYLKTHFASIFVAACAILLARAAWATTWYVDAATGSSSHSGKSMSDAFAYHEENAPHQAHPHSMPARI